MVHWRFLAARKTKASTIGKRPRKPSQHIVDSDDIQIPMDEGQAHLRSSIDAEEEGTYTKGGVMATDDSEFDEEEQALDPHADEDEDEEMHREEEEDFGDPERNREQYLARLKVRLLYRLMGRC